MNRCTSEREGMTDVADSIPPAEIARLSHFLSSFYRESDKGAALAAGAILEDLLGELLRACLAEVPQTTELLEGGHAPLGSLSSRALVCRSLGLLEDLEFREITAIRRIRNEFAHAWSSTSFNEPPVSDLVKSMCNVLPDVAATDVRKRFNASVANLLGELLWRERLVRAERREVRNWSHKAGFRPA